MGDIVIRAYESKDEQAIWHCIEKLQEHLVSVDRWNAERIPANDFGRRYVADLLKQIAKEEGRIFVAESEGKVVGFIAGIIRRFMEDDASCLAPSINGRILELFVEEGFRGQKIGRRLMEAMEEYFKEKGCRLVRVEAFAPNGVARQFYEDKCGYEEWLVDYVKELET